MIHARIVENVSEESAAEITAALMGRDAPSVPTRLEGARLPPIGVPVRTLQTGSVAQAMASLRGVLPKAGK